MKKKIILSLVAAVAVIGGVAAMSAYEAHVINVTAKIENALSVTPEEIMFGTVFPQEKLYKNLTVSLSGSFLAEDRVDDVEYIIAQKPKPRNPEDWQSCLEDWADCGKYATSWEDCFENWYDLTTCYPPLCPYISKLPDGTPENDTGVEAPDFWNYVAHGYLSKIDEDIEDNWTIDLVVPCFEGMCDQGYDWEEFGYPLPPELESEIFGCDLWIEVTYISLPPSICEEKTDVMLVLDRSGSVAGEIATLKTAALGFVTALAPSTDGVHMGQTSFADTGSLDLHLTSDTTAINAAINAIVSGGYTNLYEGILLAKIELDNPGDGHDRPDGESPDYMVIITDGFPNRPVGTAEADAIAAANAAKAAGVTIFVVGVGTTPETADWLQDNIASGHEYYFDAGDWDQLQSILEDIATCNG